MRWAVAVINLDRVAVGAKVASVREASRAGGDLGEIVNYLDVVWGNLEISCTCSLQRPCNGALERRRGLFLCLIRCSTVACVPGAHHITHRMSCGMDAAR